MRGRTGQTVMRADGCARRRCSLGEEQGLERERTVGFSYRRVGQASNARRDVDNSEGRPAVGAEVKLLARMPLRRRE